MFGSKSGAKNTIDSLIGVTTRIEGDIHFVGGLRIDGHVKGNVIADDEQSSMLVISEHARVDGAIVASHLVVNGTITGPVYASDLLELQPKARVSGDLRYRALEMHHGAIIDGTLTHVDEDDRPGLKLAASNG
jgi:cytoskeletal protein CcmA (bactofilin family)